MNSIEQRKKIEIEHYDRKAVKLLLSEKNAYEGFAENAYPFSLASYKFLREYLKEKCIGKKILDYGCGEGVNSFWLAGLGGEVIGVDLSEKALKVAENKFAKNADRSKVKFLVQDCERLEFPENYFDIVFDGESFPSLDLNNAFAELVKVLRPDGFIIGIETFGHNPFTNLKRQINKISKRGTSWATGHIFSLKDLNLAKKFFDEINVFYFHPFSWLAIPFAKHRSFNGFLLFLETIDKFFLKMSFFRKYSFKVVFIFSKPKKAL